MDKLIHINNDQVFAATTMKVMNFPEHNNMALHVCINPEDIMINRKRLEKEINIPLSHWALPWQKHTANIVRVTKEDWSKGSIDKNTSIMNVDAVYTTEKETLIGVFTADCVGLVLYDPTTPCIATIHSGWKGTVQAITYQCAKKLIEQGLIHPETTQAFFSPSILFDSLEVGMEVIDMLKENHIDMTDCVKYMPNNKAYIDNQGMNIHMLHQCGITNIHPSTYDTKINEHCFSYRNEGKNTGEHFTFAYLK